MTIQRDDFSSTEKVQRCKANVSNKSAVATSTSPTVFYDKPKASTADI
jgi:hypothetical protein